MEVSWKWSNWEARLCNSQHFRFIHSNLPTQNCTIFYLLPFVFSFLLGRCHTNTGVHNRVELGCRYTPTCWQFCPYRRLHNWFSPRVRVATPSTVWLDASPWSPSVKPAKIQVQAVPVCFVGHFTCHTTNRVIILRNLCEELKYSVSNISKEQTCSGCNYQRFVFLMAGLPLAWWCFSRVKTVMITATGVTIWTAYQLQNGVATPARLLYYT